MCLPQYMTILINVPFILIFYINRRRRYLKLMENNNFYTSYMFQFTFVLKILSYKKPYSHILKTLKEAYHHLKHKIPILYNH